MAWRYCAEHSVVQGKTELRGKIGVAYFANNFEGRGGV